MPLSTPVVFHYHTKKDLSQIISSGSKSMKAAQHAGILPVGFSPADTDILCGRGKAFANHPGNKTFSNIVRDNLQRYVDAPKRMDKSIVVASVVCEIISSGTRFVKQEKRSGRWYQMNQDQMHEKTGHAIRDLIKSSNIVVPSKDIGKSNTFKRVRSSTSSAKSSQAKKTTRRTSRRSTLTLEPINVLSEAFCHSTVQTDVSRNFSLTTSDILSKVLEAQDAIHDDFDEEEAVPPPPDLKPIVTDDTFGKAGISSTPVDIAVDIDAQEIFASGDFLLNEEDEDFMDVFSVTNNNEIIPNPVRSSCVPAAITVAAIDTPNVCASDFAKVYEILSSDDDSSVEGHTTEEAKVSRMAASICC
jgi:hypothetical protein